MAATTFGVSAGFVTGGTVPELGFLFLFDFFDRSENVVRF